MANLKTETYEIRYGSYSRREDENGKSSKRGKHRLYKVGENIELSKEEIEKIPQNKIRKAVKVVKAGRPFKLPKDWKEKDQEQILKLASKLLAEKVEDVEKAIEILEAYECKTP